MTGLLAARCHCGAISFNVELIDGFNGVRRCNCSFCHMRGAVVVPARLPELETLKENPQLSEYRFNTRTVAHYFCQVCGIYTFHQRRSNPQQYAVNVACIEGVSPFDFAVVDVADGINHPQDGGKGDTAGRLHYVAK